MNRYKATGTIQLVEYCGCDDCSGHVHEKSIRIFVEAKNQTEAEDEATKAIQKRFKAADVIEGLEGIAVEFLEEIPEAEMMRRIGAPELPLRIQ